MFLGRSEAKKQRNLYPVLTAIDEAGCVMVQQVDRDY